MHQSRYKMRKGQSIDEAFNDDFFFEYMASHSGTQQTIPIPRQLTEPRPLLLQHAMQLQSKDWMGSGLHSQIEQQMRWQESPRQQVSKQFHHRQSHIRHWHIDLNQLSNLHHVLLEGKEEKFFGVEQQKIGINHVQISWASLIVHSHVAALNLEVLSSHFLFSCLIEGIHLQLLFLLLFPKGGQGGHSFFLEGVYLFDVFLAKAIVEGVVGDCDEVFAHIRLFKIQGAR